MATTIMIIFFALLMSPLFIILIWNLWMMVKELYYIFFEKRTPNLTNFAVLCKAMMEQQSIKNKMQGDNPKQEYTLPKEFSKL